MDRRDAFRMHALGYPPGRLRLCRVAQSHPNYQNKRGYNAALPIGRQYRAEHWPSLFLPQETRRLSVAALFSASPIHARAESFDAKKTLIAETARDLANRNASLEEIEAALEQNRNKLLEAFEQLSTAIVRSVRTSDCRKAAEQFAAFSKKLADLHIEALEESKKTIEDRNRMSPTDFSNKFQGLILFATRANTTLYRSRLDFADAALAQHCTDLANIFYRNVFAYGPPEFSKRAELGLRDVDAQRAKSK
jgi:hypothetical protein